MRKRNLLLLILVLCLVFLGCSGQQEPTAEQIMSDLIGQRLQSVRSGFYWEFAALSEFEHFDIRGKQVQGDIIEYDVSMRLQDLITNNNFLADALIVYRQIDGKWELTSIVTKLLKPL